MEYNDLLSRLCKIKGKLQDVESQIIYDARINYLFTRNEDEYYKVLETVRKDSYCLELEDFLKDNKENQGMIIYGAETEGVRTKRLLDNCKRPAQLFCDDSEKIIGSRIEGLEVISVRQLVTDYNKYVVILAGRIVMAERYSLLLRSGFPRKQILFPMHMHLVASNGTQYFDVLSSVEDEIFIDAGAYNGDTIAAFQKWTKGKYKRIYAFEPNVEMAQATMNYLRQNQVENVVFTPKATWGKEEVLSFFEDASASRVGKGGETCVQAVDIDSVVGDEKVTFIKMDVEGSELQSLIGAQRTISMNKPRLAISVYHKPEDVIEIAEYILSLNPKYNFILRQYNSNFWETILYAF